MNKSEHISLRPGDIISRSSESDLIDQRQQAFFIDASSFQVFLILEIGISASQKLTVLGQPLEVAVGSLSFAQEEPSIFEFDSAHVVGHILKEHTPQLAKEASLKRGTIVRRVDANGQAFGKKFLVESAHLDGLASNPDTLKYYNVCALEDYDSGLTTIKAQYHLSPAENIVVVGELDYMSRVFDKLFLSYQNEKTEPVDLELHAVRSSRYFG